MLLKCSSKEIIGTERSWNIEKDREIVGRWTADLFNTQDMNFNDPT